MPEGKVPIPIVRTKLHIPSTFGEFVCRDRLHAQLERGLEGPLTLVSAPAGYGKSVLVGHWAEKLDIPCGWVSLDESDSDLSTFMVYLVAAIRSVIPNAVNGIIDLLASPNLPPVPVTAGIMVNEFEDLDSPLVIVLDDFHRIAPGSAVHEFVRALIAHPPSGLNIVITTRTDPPLPMAALRAGRQAMEVRLRDLQFTTDEVASYLGQNLDLTLSEAALKNLMVQTEGWAVGLQFVSLHLRQVDDPNAFLISLEGGVLRTQEYLLHEVLGKQSVAVRECMLKASLLDQFNADLLDHLCATEGEPAEDQPSGRDLIEILHRENLFTISLDASGEWFRYHHLFQGLLGWELERLVGEEEVSDLNLRISLWFEGKGLIAESIFYAIKAGKPQRSTDIIIQNRNAEFDKDHWFVVEKWLAMIPEEYIQDHPELLLTQAWIFYYRLQLDRVLVLTERAGLLMEENKQSTAFQGEIGFFRGILEYWAGDSASSVATFEQSLELFENNETFCGSQIQIHLGLARCMEGRGGEAVQALEELIEGAVSSESIYFSHILAGKVFAHLMLGQLPLACTNAKRLIAVTGRCGFFCSEAWGNYLLGCCLFASGNFQDAIEKLGSATSKRYVLDPVAVADGLVGLAIAHQMLDRVEEADVALLSLGEFAAEANDTHCLLVAESGRARLSLLRGEQPTDLSWAMSGDSAPEPAELFLWMEVPLMTRVKVLIASGSNKGLERAESLVHAVRKVADECRFTGHQIEILVLQAVVLDLQGQPDEASSVLSEAVALAEVGSWVRPFLEVGSVLPRMIHRLAEREIDSHFLQHLMKLIENSGRSFSRHQTSVQAGAGVDDLHLESLDGLTNRELDVLDLLARRLRNKEIADHLCVSSHTVNFHLKQIYSKLGVHNRRQAVDRGLETGIIKLRAGD